MAMNKLLSQTQCLPQSTPATPTPPHFLFSSMSKQPATETVQHPSPTHHPLITPLLSTSPKASVAIPATMPVSVTTTVSAIPTSLQRIVQGNPSIAAQQPPFSPSFHSIGLSHSESNSLPREQEYSPTSSSSPANTTPHPHPISLSMTSATVLPKNPSDEIGPTPLTPLSPYCGQQGMFWNLTLYVCYSGGQMGFCFSFSFKLFELFV